MASDIQKGTLGHVQKVCTQTSCRVSSYFDTCHINDAYVSSCGNNLITYSCFQYRVGADLSLHYLLCPKVPFGVTLAIYPCCSI